jgi:DNA polymerase I-like protein with 3'-5' exonuclease and polymerase domains
VLHGDIHTLNQKKAGTATRAQAKTLLYAILFGAGPANIAKQLGTSTRDAKAMTERFIRNMPKLGVLLSGLEKEWSKRAHQRFNKKRGQMQLADGWIKGLDGRRVVVESSHKLLNYQLQSDEAIHMSHAYVLVHEEMDRRGYKLGVDWNMLIFYHDEVDMEARTKEIAEVCGEVASWAITQAGIHLGIACHHEGSIKHGNNWKEVH